jgi:hypothetical protein
VRHTRYGSCFAYLEGSKRAIFVPRHPVHTRYACGTSSYWTYLLGCLFGSCNPRFGLKRVYIVKFFFKGVKIPRQIWCFDTEFDYAPRGRRGASIWIQRGAHIYSKPNEKDKEMRIELTLAAVGSVLRSHCTSVQSLALGSEFFDSF